MIMNETDQHEQNKDTTVDSLNNSHDGIKVVTKTNSCEKDYLYEREEEAEQLLKKKEEEEKEKVKEHGVVDNNNDELDMDEDDNKNKDDDIEWDPKLCSVTILGAGLTGLATALLLAKNDQLYHQEQQQMQQQQQQQQQQQNEQTDTEPSHDKKQQQQQKYQNRRHHSTTSSSRSPRIIRIYERDDNDDCLDETMNKDDCNNNKNNHIQKGYGLTLTYDPNGILHHLGILDTLANLDCPSRSHYLFYQQQQQAQQQQSSSSLQSQEQKLDPYNTDHKKDDTKKDDDISSSCCHIIGYYGNDFHYSSPQQLQQQNQQNQNQQHGYGQRGNLRVPRQQVRRVLLEQIQQQYTNIQIYWNHTFIKTTSTSIPTETTTTTISPSRTTNGTVQSSNQNGKSLKDSFLYLHFTNGTIVPVTGLLLATDGIHSPIVQSIYPNIPPPTSLHVKVIVGITTFTNTSTTNLNDCSKYPDLLKERGFYTISDNGIRLFVMPYSTSSSNELQQIIMMQKEQQQNQQNQNHPTNTITSGPQYMWQLSYREDLEPIIQQQQQQEYDDNTSSKNNNNNNNTYRRIQKGILLQQMALQLTKGWHEPVQMLLSQTQPNSIWGTLLKDRDPQQIYQFIQQTIIQNQQKQQQQKQNGQSLSSICLYDRVIIAGDALHAMSPFKGQGANNCLRDAQTIAKWFSYHHHTTTTTNNNKKNVRKDRKKNKKEMDHNNNHHNNNNNNTNTITTKKSSVSTSSFHACFKGCMRELVQRTTPIVQSSREAAYYWHGIQKQNNNNNNSCNNHLPTTIHEDLITGQFEYKFAGIMDLHNTEDNSHIDDNDNNKNNVTERHDVLLQELSQTLSSSLSSSSQQQSPSATVGTSTSNPNHTNNVPTLMLLNEIRRRRIHPGIKNLNEQIQNCIDELFHNNNNNKDNNKKYEQSLQPLIIIPRNGVVLVKESNETTTTLTTQMNDTIDTNGIHQEQKQQQTPPLSRNQSLPNYTRKKKQRKKEQSDKNDNNKHDTTNRDDKKNRSTNDEMENDEEIKIRLMKQLEDAMRAARYGDLGTLRRISWYYPTLLRRQSYGAYDYNNDEDDGDNTINNNSDDSLKNDSNASSTKTTNCNPIDCNGSNSISNTHSIATTTTTTQTSTNTPLPSNVDDERERLQVASSGSSSSLPYSGDDSKNGVKKNDQFVCYDHNPADADMKNWSEWVRSSTCLHAATDGRHLQVIYWLVTEAGCNVDAKDRYGQTPYDLLQQQISFRHKNNFGEKILQQQQQSDDELVQILLQRLQQRQKR